MTRAAWPGWYRAGPLALSAAPKVQTESEPVFGLLGASKAQPISARANGPGFRIEESGRAESPSHGASHGGSSYLIFREAIAQHHPHRLAATRRRTHRYPA